MTNWTDIHPNFTRRFQDEWEDHDFTYSQAKEWINIGLTPNDADFANWLSEEGYTALAMLDYGDSEQLKKEYLESLKTPKSEPKKATNYRYTKLLIALTILALITYYLLKN